MKILVTAFDAFGGESINPAERALELAEDLSGRAELVKLVVPTVFSSASELARAAILRERPDAVLCLGQAGGRAGISVERVAVNVMDARIADNSGAIPVDEPVIASAPAAYFATLPIKRIVDAIRAQGVPASVSNSAGTFVCNSLMFSVLHTLETELPGAIGGFIHVPFEPAQVLDKPNAPSMSLDDIVKAVNAALLVIANE